MTTSPRRPIVIGSDTELGNFLLGVESRNGTGQTASRALLREIKGFASSASGTGQCNCASCVARRRADEESGMLSTSGGSSSSSYGSQDWGRKYLATNGGCVYIDLDHLELCTPEVTSAYDFVAAWHAMLRTARGALDAVNAKAPNGVRVMALVNNSDGQGNSYGGHLSYLVSRRAWDNIFHRKVHYLLFLAAHQASSIVYTGAGKVGSENGQPAVPFQLSQRADFFETLQGVQTTFRRPIVNSRDETLCGRHGATSITGSTAHSDDDGLARLHVIFYDASLCHASCLLKVGTMQMVLAMIEAGRINPSLILDDPLEALVAWSQDPGLKAKARMASGDEMTAVEVQWKLFEDAKRFADAGGFEGVVPRWSELLELWGDTLQKLEHRDYDALGRRLDWVLKWHALNRAIARRPDLTWDAPELKHLDHLYCSLDSTEGLYWNYERAGVLERYVTDEQIEQLVHEPPEDTRAFTRAKLMRLAGPERVDNIDWDTMRFKVQTSRGWPSYPSIDLGDPLAWTKPQTETLLDGDRDLEDVLTALKEIDAETPAARGEAPSASSGGELITTNSSGSSGNGSGPRTHGGGYTSKKNKKKSKWSAWGM